MGIRSGLVVALMLRAATAAASPAEPVGSYARLQPLGWTADSASFAFRAHEDMAGGMPDPDPDAEAYTADVGVVVDAATGQSTYYLVKLDGHVHADTQHRLGPPRAKELERWIASHKPRLVKGRRDLAIALTTLHDQPPIVVAWSGDHWEFDAKDPDAIGAGGRIALAVGQRVVLHVTADGGAGNCGGTITPFWSPDGRRIAWWIHHDLQVSDFPAYDELWITPARAPRVDVKPDKSLAPAARDTALRALDHAGFAPVVSGDAGAHRAATVVYAAPGFEADARRAAAALGGTVDKLTWKPDADLVVALGGGSSGSAKPGPAFACAGREARLSAQPPHGPAFLVTLSCDGNVPRVITGRDGDPPNETIVAPAAWEGVWKQLEAAHWRTASTACTNVSPDPWWDVTVRQGATTRHWTCPDGTSHVGGDLGAPIWNAEQLPAAH